MGSVTGGGDVTKVCLSISSALFYILLTFFVSSKLGGEYIFKTDENGNTEVVYGRR